MKRSLRSQAGFTLLEIMMVVMIIALLAGVAINAMRDQIDVAGDAKARADINAVGISLMTYRSSNGFYPTTEQGLKALVKKPESEPRPRSWRQAFPEVPQDAWKQDYFYEQPGKHNPDKYDLYSAGPDRKPGTADDIGNWKSET